ncbi:MAG: bifunctional alpha,alpha-trehalose-phosphate synthase (UDP-forming)/trehalose-phosphatase [bacterium]|nr:bifunctional alpha,alpha-trehalose-phosphate synthase (UDP-forming)/trehalose-phosphatase [bacterium]
MPAITIVSNRLPVSIKKNEDGRIEVYPSIGGLATGLAGYTKDPQTKWIGWPGIPSDDLTENDKKTIASKLKKHNCYPVYLTKKQIEAYYNGYCNSVLWPIFHNLTADKARVGMYKAYENVNSIFAGAVDHYAKKSKTIWIHDYQLMLVPRLLRSKYPLAKIGFFLHIPFPATNYYSKIDERLILLRGILGADLVGFHTKYYCNNFLENVDIEGAGKVNENAVVNGRRTSLIAEFPMGIDYKRFTSLSSSIKVKKNLATLRKKYGDKRLIFTNDRLDPSKGLPHKIKAFGKLLESKSNLRGKVVMAMLVAPSRTEIKAYKNLKTEIDGLINDINQKYGTKKWLPIDYMYRTMDFNEISAYYQMADIAFVTPVRDGMNLVAKEFIASKPDRKGVLILSETAGAAEELEHALLVNPRHHNSLVGALHQALTMPDIELKKRLGIMQKHLSQNTVQDWAKKFVGKLNTPAKNPLPLAKKINASIEQKILADYKNAKNRLLIFDYDGVLTPIVDLPELAKPTKNLKSTLKRLSELPNTKLAVVSGRSKKDLDSWLGDLPITLAAEHGAFSKSDNKWHESALLSKSWKIGVLRTMNRMATATPNSFVEEKTNALVWHYRQVPKSQGAASALLLRQLLKAQLVGTNLGVYSGKMIIEVKSKIINKGTVVRSLLNDAPDFVLIAGDDYTDEDMFKVSPKNAYTIRVGEGLTRANNRVDNSGALISLIKKLKT